MLFRCELCWLEVTFLALQADGPGEGLYSNQNLEAEENESKFHHKPMLWNIMGILVV